MRLKPQAYAITINTHARHRLFQRTANAELLVATLFRYRDQSRFLLHGFVVMPDHLHVLLTPAESTAKSIQLIKGGFSFTLRDQFKGEVWHTGHHEHRIRDEADYAAQLAYIANNPTRRVPGAPHLAFEMWVRRTLQEHTTQKTRSPRQDATLTPCRSPSKSPTI